jgi:hypothetical protein
MRQIFPHKFYILSRAQTMRKSLSIIFFVLLFCGLVTQKASAQVWGTQSDYFIWYSNSNLANATVGSGITLTATNMAGGSGVTMTTVSEGSPSANIFKMVGVAAGTTASAITANDYIYTTIAVPVGHKTVRLSQMRVNGYPSGGSNPSGGAYGLGIVVVDMATSVSTTIITDFAMANTSAGNLITPATPYEMVAGKTYQVRWLISTASGTTRAIDNPVLSFQEIVCYTGVTAPALSATTKSSTCPALTVDLTTITASNTPANTVLEWHNATPATSGNKVPNAAAVTAGVPYYAVFYDASNNCYSNTSGSTGATTVTTTLSVCTTVPATISGVTSATITGNAPSATGGTGAYGYSDGSGNAGCVAPVGYMPLTGAGGTVNSLNASTGAHTVTAPSAAGSYYYCIKVCDASGTNCGVSIHKVTVTATPVVVTTPATISGVTSATIPGNAPSATGGTGAYGYSDGSGEAGCVAPVGYMPLTGSGGTVNSLNASTGAHTVTAPSAAGSYYYCIKVCDASGTNCGVSIHKVVVATSVTPVVVTAPAAITGVSGTTITGTVPSATGGTSPYMYSNGSSDAGCIAPSGYTSLSAAGGSITGLNTSTGTHTITAPNAVGSYYYCIKVCDTSGTNCAVSNHTVTVTAVTCRAGYSSPKIVKN